MADNPSNGEIGLEVVAPDRSRRFVRFAELPFLIGRSGATAKHLQLTDPRISRQCAAIVSEDGRYFLEDRGQRHGIFVNGEKTTRRMLEDGDVISFGVDNFYELIFRSSSSLDTTLPDLLSRIDGMSAIRFTQGEKCSTRSGMQMTAQVHSRHL